MRKKNTGFIFWVVVFCSFSHSSSSNEDDKSRQTFVIRYKDGEQTIPVTVVLDYKKQTEYVINMNPRASAKSVTLYDFKQRTIAYKDLTNRECFLGRLTHETLSEEVNALQDVKNPVEGKPKMRSLDPRWPALTPTEIRNIAGQKTAVFCRKMNTWLLMPEKNHGISKREVDEFEERTLQYHGHRSSQYSHYERETRRRYRNRSQASSRRRSQKNKSEAENENGRPAVSESSLNPHQISGQSSGNNYLNSGYSEKIPDANNSSSFPAHQKPYSSTLRNIEGDRENVNRGISFASSIPSRRYTSTNTVGYPGYGSRLASSSGNPTYPRQSFGTSDYFATNETNGSPVLDHEVIPGTFERSRPLEEIVAENFPATTERNSATDYPSVTSGQEGNYPNVHPSLLHLIPVYKPLSQEFDFGRQNSLEPGTPPQKGHEKNIESELHPLLPAHSEQDKFIHPTNEHVTPQDPDVSVNVLEVPRISKEFENVKVNSSYLPPPNTENTREIPNSVESHPPASRTHFRSPPYFQSRNLPNVSTAHFEHVGPSSDFIGNNFHNHRSDVSATTTLPVLTTPEYGVTDRTTSHSAYVPSVHTAFQNSEDFNSFQIFPSYIENSNHLSFEKNLTAPSVHASNIELIDDRREGITHNAFLTTENPQMERKRKTNLNHRSDIPSEDSSVRSSSSSHGTHVARITYPSFISNTTNENVPTYRIRYQNALRDFKPDEIVIDVENIPTHTIPPVTSSFQRRILTTIQPTVRSLRSGVIRSGTDRKSEQTSGTTLRTLYPTTRYPKVRTSHKSRRPIQTGSIAQSQGVSLNQHNNHDIKPQPQINQLVGVNHYSPPQHTNRRQFTYQNRPYPPVQVRMPTEINQLHHFNQFKSLPPGVSMHPRHPQAPFADMVHSNRPPTIPLARDHQASLKPHRQRHHRKKDRHPNSCCRLRGKTGAFQSCCRNGGPCCSISQRRLQPPGSSCCSSSKAIGQVIPANQIQPPLRTTYQNSPPVRTEESHRSDTGSSKDRCQKEKMCRTLYESTQQVMVCRNGHVEGCL